MNAIVKNVLLVFAALLPIVNPLGMAPIFAEMTTRSILKGVRKHRGICCAMLWVSHERHRKERAAGLCRAASHCEPARHGAHLCGNDNTVNPERCEEAPRDMLRYAVGLA